MDSTDKYDFLRRMLVNECVLAGLKQTDVSSKLGKPQSYISKIERGERSVDVIEFIEIAQAIGFDPATFLNKLK